MTTLFKILIVIIYVGVMTSYFEPVNGDHVLAISPFGGKSHLNVMKGILRALTDHGHRVTVFTPVPDGNRYNYTEVDVSKEIEVFVQLDINDVHDMFTRQTDLVNFLHAITQNGCKSIYANKAVKKIITNHNSGFSVIIVDIMASECVSYIPYTYLTYLRHL